MKFGVVVFPGSNCDYDCYHVLKHVLGQETDFVWHKDRAISKYDCIVIPGGFSYGDYLRCGALAGKAPVMDDVKKAAETGVPVLGICNGFQILCETQLLPGALVRNTSLRFIDQWTDLKLENNGTSFWKLPYTEVRLPIAHGEGRYVINEEGLKQIQDGEQIWWTYKNNPNGSQNNIAGVLNAKKNVAGLMPHPERAVASWMGSSAGREFFNF